MRLFFLSLILSLSATCAFAAETDDHKYMRRTDPSQPPSAHPAESQDELEESDNSPSGQNYHEASTGQTGLRNRNRSCASEQEEELEPELPGDRALDCFFHKFLFVACLVFFGAVTSH